MVLAGKVVVGMQTTGGVDEALREVGVDLPSADGMGESVAGDPAANAHVIELGGVDAQASLDVAQAGSVGELSERHAAVLVGAGERPCGCRGSGPRSDGNCARADGP